MAYDVVIGGGAMRDMRAIHRFISEQESPLRAERVANRLMERILSLDSLPYRGRRFVGSSEIEHLEYRELLMTPFRIIYRVDRDLVDVLMIVDSRRNLDELFLQELSSR